MKFSSIWPIDKTLSGAVNPVQSGPESDGNKGIFCIPQSSSVTGASLSNYLPSYPEHSLEESYSSAEMQLEYSTAPANKVKTLRILIQLDALKDNMVNQTISWAASIKNNLLTCYLFPALQWINKKIYFRLTDWF